MSLFTVIQTNMNTTIQNSSSTMVTTSATSTSSSYRPWFNDSTIWNLVGMYGVGSYNERPPSNIPVKVGEVQNEWHQGGYPCGSNLPIVNGKVLYTESNPTPWKWGFWTFDDDCLAKFLAEHGDELYYQCGQTSYPSLHSLDRILNSEWEGYNQQQLSTTQTNTTIPPHSKSLDNPAPKLSAAKIQRKKNKKDREKDRDKNRKTKQDTLYLH